MSKTFVIVDLEATCWDSADKNKPAGFVNEIIEIGAVRCNLEGDVIDEFDIFAKPKKFPIISPFCYQLTTITQNDINTAVDAKTALEQFFIWALGEEHADAENVKFVSWGMYDKNQFRKDLLLNDLDVEVINDANHYSLKHYHSQWANVNKPKGIGLGRACVLENIEFTGTAHRGIDDAKNIAKIFKKYIDYFQD